MNGEKTYTYRGGKRVELVKSPDEMVVRSLPDRVVTDGVTASEQVSSASTRVKTRRAELDDMMGLSRESAVTHHAYYEADSEAEFLITDRVFISFRQGTSTDQVDEFAGRYALLKSEQYGTTDYLFQLTNHTNMNPVKLVVALMENEPLVVNAEHDLNQRMTTYQIQAPSDPEFIRQWHLHTALNDPEYDTRACSLCEDAWFALESFGDSEVVVAVTDDGCKLDHQDFNSTNKFRSWGYLRGTRLISSSDIDADPDEMYQSGSNHGTSCAGVIAGDVNSALTVGAAPDCRLLPIQWESSGPSLFISDSKLLTVLDYIADKADIMSNSWGSSPTSTWALPVLNRISTLSQTGGRRGNGIVFLWAAGNENCPIDLITNTDVPYSNGWRQNPDNTWSWVGVRRSRNFRHNLTELPGVMHIAALASTAQRSHYSNYGPSISLCAPSSNSHAYFRASVRGLGITTTTGNPQNVTDSFGGTSSATPLVAGVAALIISANPALGASDVIQILKQTASKQLDMQGYPRTGPASYDLNPNWDVSPIAPFEDGAFTDTGDPDGTWSPWFGFGRVDAVAAVTRALAELPGTPGISFSGSSSPNTDIPDNDSDGVLDVIVCDQQISLQSISIAVEIDHTYIGDLRITLFSPAGTEVILHDRNGGNSDDLVTTFDTGNTPGLSALRDESAEGAWALLIQDMAAVDNGQLKQWSLDISGALDTAAYVEDTPALVIPDNASGGITRQLNVSGDGLITDIAVELDITHSYIGDLTVELVSPGNTSVMLHQRSGGPADNIINSFNVINTPSMSRFIGEQGGGNWQLRVSDHARADEGKLNFWALLLDLSS